jgi:hypothetical protein
VDPVLQKSQIFWVRGRNHNDIAGSFQSTLHARINTVDVGSRAVIAETTLREEYWT